MVLPKYLDVRALQGEGARKTIILWEDQEDQKDWAGASVFLAVSIDVSPSSIDVEPLSGHQRP